MSEVLLQSSVARVTSWWNEATHYCLFHCVVWRPIKEATLWSAANEMCIKLQVAVSRIGRLVYSRRLGRAKSR